MKQHKWIIGLVISGVIGFAFIVHVQKKNEWIILFNGKDLGGWDTWIGPPLDDAGKKLTETPVGLNNDPNHVFTIVKDNGENVIRISGEKWGGISTKEEYENFHLQLMFK